MSPRQNWDSPNPSLASECAPPPGTKGRLVKSLALCLLCGLTHFEKSQKFSGFWIFLFYVRYTTLLHLPPLRFYCVGGCWDGTQDCCDFGIDSQTL